MFKIVATICLSGTIYAKVFIKGLSAQSCSTMVLVTPESFQIQFTVVIGRISKFGIWNRDIYEIYANLKLKYYILTIELYLKVIL